MKHPLLFALLMILTSGWVDSCDPSKPNPPCDSKLWAHTYGAMTRFANPPERLVLRHRCVTVTGTVVGPVSEERDGDLKIKISLARENFKPYGPFENRDEILKNNPGGLLVVEVVCANPGKILEAQRNEPDPAKKPHYQGMIDACKGYRNKVVRPATGDTIAVTGELVMDTGPSSKNPIQDHGWREIHPVTRIDVLTKPKGTLSETR